MGLAILPSFNEHLQRSKAINITLKAGERIHTDPPPPPLLFKVTQSLGGKILGYLLACDSRGHTLGTLLAEFRKNPCQMYC